MESVLLVLSLGCVVSFVILSLMMAHEVSKHGVKINFPFFRLFVIKYIHQYKQITKNKTGRVGPLFYPCIVFINAALILALASILF